MTEPVRSTRNPRVTEAVRLHRARERRRTGCTLLEGPNLVAEAVAAGVSLGPVFALSESPPIDGIDWVTVTEPVLARLAPTEHPRGPVAVMSIPSHTARHVDVVVVDVADPGNAGTLIRTAAAFRQDVVIRPGGVDPWAPKVLRAGAGAHFHTRLLREAGDVGTIATVARGGVAPSDLARHLDARRRWAVLVGSEAQGLDADDVDMADVRVTIPMPGGIESLNAAVAGAIVAHELARWRNAAGPIRADH